MLTKLIGRSLTRLGSFVGRNKPDPEELAAAQKLAASGDSRGAAKAFREYLKSDPYNVAAINDLGICLSDLGDDVGAQAQFELAHSLDDTVVATMANYAKLLVDGGKSDEALKLLHRAKITNPHFMHTDAVYAAICMRRGEVGRARRHHLRAWLANFDVLRHANALMFGSCYDDIDEEQVAMEHRFWAETVIPPKPPAQLGELPDVADEGVGTAPGLPDTRLRIGYWSPDFRSHSVRYFFRPLLEGHDTNVFEVFLFHDVHAKDAQTERIRAKSEHFYDVHELSDPELIAFVQSKNLDILVELAGHTSHNRLGLLRQRMATVQLTGLGYPPTTGLTSVDAKILDRHTVVPQSAKFYSEEPLALPSSFWCYDPVEDDPHVADEPPMVRNGFVTFACLGNTSKVNARLLTAWKEILERVPQSRLVIRSLHFDDPIGERSMRATLVESGFPMERVDLLRSAPPNEFYASYNDIDIVLDTYPFNGGTTTCFAIYMGVPVVSITGQSLASRMGLSILSNLGAEHLATNSHTEYVERAIQLAADREFIRSFRREARGRFKSTPLGNAKLFAADFEAAVKQLMEKKRAGGTGYATQVAPLPVQEIMRRAYEVTRRMQTDAAQRIIDHCLACYPGAAAPRVLRAQLWAWEGKIKEALDYLASNLPERSADRASLVLTLLRLELVLGETGRAREALALLPPQIADPFDRAQARVYRACLGEVTGARPTPAPPPPRSVRVLVPCSSKAEYERVWRQMSSTCRVPAGWRVDYVRVEEKQRLFDYRAAMNSGAVDTLVVVQKNAQVHNPDFFGELGMALENADVVGIGGCERWIRMDWREDDFARKFGGQLGSVGERPHMVELQLVGEGFAKTKAGMAVLDGTVLAIDRKAFAASLFDEELIGAGTLLEEAWTCAASQAGARLMAHRNLGVFIDLQVQLDDRYWTDARTHWAALSGVDPFNEDKPDYVALSAPLSSCAEAVAVCDRFFE